MKKVTIEFTDDDARSIEYFLKARYNKDGRTNLDKLCKIAVLKEVSEEAQRQLDEYGYDK